jgi:hypothetical protein
MKKEKIFSSFYLKYTKTHIHTQLHNKKSYFSLIIKSNKNYLKRE